MEANQAQTATAGYAHDLPELPKRTASGAGWQVKIASFIRTRPGLTLLGGFVVGFVIGMWARR